MKLSAQSSIALLAIALVLFPSGAGARTLPPPKPASEGANPYMTSEERATAVKLLLDTRKEFLDSITDLTDEQWNFRPGLFKWTIAQVSEHIILAEASLFQQLKKAVDSPVNPDWEAKTTGKTEMIYQIMPSSSAGKAHAPWEIQPMGKLSKAEAIRRYNETRDQILQLAEQTQVPLKEHTCDHPFPKFGTLSAYQWLVYIPLHNKRHNEQIAAVKASPGYPK
jgi:hypothetical protein